MSLARDKGLNLKTTLGKLGRKIRAWGEGRGGRRTMILWLFFTVKRGGVRERSVKKLPLHQEAEGGETGCGQIGRWGGETPLRH